ncbi:MocR-like pyridoxine biosynthesis transcription factor PdxR [Micromonospora andamanensis]|uniref:MocR-like pyridoxine biosynthesis transcription factor PdxR n=1 Tax=Micromonospora andamanensis TaxID=1287068 RepID=UPI00194E12B9|nr:PLP-dependent aminotransferase family protein [Micromonospora andamanensis]GIJ38958.1 GntR family transcriptional regulator [Micromonospora andamanensis]
MPWHLTISVCRDVDEPLSRQIQSAIKEKIRNGVLLPGVPLPSSRLLARDIGVSRSVVVEAYEQMSAEGYLEAVQGSGTRVATRPVVGVDRGSGLDEPTAPAVRWDLRVGATDVTNFPLQEWLSCYQRATQSLGANDLSYPPITGIPALRTELASYLGRVRGVRVEPAHTMVTMGFAHGLGLICRTLPTVGIDRIGVENPGSGKQFHFIRSTGMRAVPVPVDADGVDLDALARSGVRAVLITAAHQFPTGATMSLERRQALLRWASDVDGIIIEDDYDTEFWFDQRERPPAIQGSDPERVVYGGSLSKVLAPGLRLGWLAVPEWLFGAVERARATSDQGSDSITQLAVSEFLRAGLLDRHLRRLRPRYRSRLETVVQAVRRHLPGASIRGASAGRHVYVELPHHVDEAAVVDGALRLSVLLRGGAHFRLAETPRLTTPPALVIGYSAVRPSDINEALARVGESYARYADPRPNRNGASLTRSTGQPLRIPRSAAVP